jgi:hypothetical protein
VSEQVVPKVRPRYMRVARYADLAPEEWCDTPIKQEMRKQIAKQLFPYNAYKQYFFQLMLDRQADAHYAVTVSTRPPLIGSHEADWDLGADQVEALANALMRRLNRELLGRHNDNNPDRVRAMTVFERGERRGRGHIHCVLGVPASYRRRFATLIEEEKDLRIQI